ncbi:DUF2922 domain-containing protein [Clostridium chromiireducens]|nr:DUF2922 domain-containing protein [Clostridium chromiireducens]
MEYTLSMTFLTEAGTKASLSISGVKSTVTEAEVNALMDTIISKNVFKTNAGAFVKKADAKLTAKNVTDYSIA